MSVERSSVEKEANKLIAKAFGILVSDYSKYAVQPTSAHIYHAFNVASDMLFTASSQQMKETQVPLWDPEHSGL